MAFHIREISSVDFRYRVLTFYNNTVEKRIREDTSYSTLLIRVQYYVLRNEFLISKPYFKCIDLSTTYHFWLKNNDFFSTKN